VNREGVDKADLTPGDSSNEGRYAVRSVQLTEDYTMLLSIPDQDILGLDRKMIGLTPARSMAKPFVSEMFGSASHILLAACAQDETAKESGGRGHFTRAFMAYLRDPAVDPAMVTFKLPGSVTGRLPNENDAETCCTQPNTARVRSLCRSSTYTHRKPSAHL
jgi:hypothetical protein